MSGGLHSRSIPWFVPVILVPFPMTQWLEPYCMTMAACIPSLLFRTCSSSTLWILDHLIPMNIIVPQCNLNWPPTASASSSPLDHSHVSLGICIWTNGLCDSQHDRKSLPCQAVEPLVMAAVNSILCICNPRRQPILPPHPRKPLGRVFSNGRSHLPSSLLLGTHYLGSGEPRSVGLRPFDLDPQ